MHSHPWFPAPALCAAVLAVCAGAGCIPENVAWLPDSSGFLFSRNDGHQLVRYDLARRSQQVVVNDTQSRTHWPALSPDGQRIAVARAVTHADRSSTVEITLYDLAGKQLQRSRPLAWPVGTWNSGSETLGETALAWAPDGDHLVVYSDHERGHTAGYDVKNERLTVIEATKPLVLGGSPIRPDGKGFLVAREKLDALAFVDWDGKVQDIKPQEAVEPDSPEAGLLVLSWLHTGGWDKDTGFLTRGTATWRIDTVKHLASYQPDGRPEGKTEPAGLREQFVFENGTVVRIVEVEEGQGAEKRRSVRVETLKAGERTPKVIVSEGDLFTCLFPSPSKELVAVRSGSEHILVLNSKVEVVAEIKEPGK
jgi:WD40-like Beta Propeller Repeat